MGGKSASRAAGERCRGEAPSGSPSKRARTESRPRRPARSRVHEQGRSGGESARRDRREPRGRAAGRRRAEWWYRAPQPRWAKGKWESPRADLQAPSRSGAASNASANARKCSKSWNCRGKSDGCSGSATETRSRTTRTSPRRPEKPRSRTALAIGGRPCSSRPAREMEALMAELRIDLGPAASDP